MYDLAKRSLACTVATGGLLLTGAAFSPAMAAGGLGTTQGPARAREAGSAVSASSALRSATASGFGDVTAKTTQQGTAGAPPDLLFTQFLSGGSAGAAGTVHPLTAPGAQTFHLPIDLGRRLCDTLRDDLSPGAAAAGACAAETGADGQDPLDAADFDCSDAVAAEIEGADQRQSACETAEGSVTTAGGASATAMSSGRGQMPIDVPESVPMIMSRSAALPMGGCDHAVRAADDEDGYGDDACTPPTHPHGYPSDSSTCTPPPPPPTCTPTKLPTTAPPTTAPPTTAPPTYPSHSYTPPPTPRFTFTPPPWHHGHLPQTGADVEIALGVAGAALLAGLGLTSASRRRQRGH